MAATRTGFPRQAGLTLVEATVVIVVLAVVGAIIVSFVQPVRGYFDTTARARLSDTADTALRRMARDLQLALPNSVRVASAGGAVYLEFLQTRSGGRYRAERDASGNGDELDFTASDGSFDMLGPPPAEPGQQIGAGDLLVVYNLGVPGADAYAGDNTAVISGAPGAGSLPGESKITFAARQFPFPSPGKRFQVVSGAVSYGCDPAAGTLTRYAGYAVAPAQPTPPAVAGAILASGVTACAIAYTPGLTTGRNGLVSMRLTLTGNGESVTLYHEVHVDNVP